MVLSYHPCIPADRNMLCAGRMPDISDLLAMRSADAVIFPQGVSRPFYEMAQEYCTRIFPDYRVRFLYPGKVGQIRLFREMNVPFPRSWVFEDVKSFESQGEKDPGLINFPLVFKFNWGGEGDSVRLVEDEQSLRALIEAARSFEKAQVFGFILQEYIPSVERTLRVVVIGGRTIAYWRVRPKGARFKCSIKDGATIDASGDPGLMESGIDAVRDFCKKCGINLAGFDLIFPLDRGCGPMFLEINYFFGRRGIGGTERFLQILNREVRSWLEEG